MYAVVRTGGKQYKVAPGDVVLVEKLDGEAGAEIKLDDILMVNDGTTTVIGSPTVEGAVVTASIIEQGRADKILVFKKKRRQGYRRMAGHRQDQTVLRILDVAGAGAKKKKAAAKKPAAKKEAPADKAEAATEE
ncbi:MAG: 50S ribosomal protein L21 [Alphaproteobacteria bacterium]|nr:50S ribosomal protein L21 [Alphaproteobacteria bacterium]MBT4082877.1 50S ribosomal protein L21 [Alphaproteobacteria bacterium]MBT4544398.1 50S ribosomal protein L21 [Alphaproteobacteria bacterium]MBT5918148.1 50S ribosomal protein L21 [Alphaproteobacteria bacterium]MBT7745222.1 50S ribosomal protein L21 [Alphaproteobacteria bacterium]